MVREARARPQARWRIAHIGQMFTQSAVARSGHRPQRDAVHYFLLAEAFTVFMVSPEQRCKLASGAEQISLMLETLLPKCERISPCEASPYASHSASRDAASIAPTPG